MPEMPEFIVQLEQASGLPWWCLLLVAVLALLVIILAVSLSNEKRRNRKARVDIPRGVSAPVAAEADIEADEPESDMEGGATGDVPAAGEAAEPVAVDEDVVDASDDADEPEPDEAPADEPSAESEDGMDAAEDADGPEPDAVSADESDKAKDALAGDGPVAPAKPKESQDAPAVIEVVDDAWRAAATSDLSDEEILKAVSGNHARMGQSAFGIDFGFLEEYESEYEHALEEFRRLRVDLDGKGLPERADRPNED